MKLLKRRSLLAAAASLLLACVCFATPAYAEPKTVATADEFIAAINDPTCAEITLNGDITIEDGTTSLTLPLAVNRDLTINGGGHTLTNASTSTNGNGERNGLNIVGGTVRINNLTIVDNNGSTLTAQNGGDAVLNNVTLDHSNSNYGCALIIADGSDVTMSGCTIKLGASSWGAVNIEQEGTVTLGNPTVSGDAGKALVYVDNSSNDISTFVMDADQYLEGPIADGKNKPAVTSTSWTVTSTLR